MNRAFDERRGFLIGVLALAGGTMLGGCAGGTAAYGVGVGCMLTVS